MGDNSIYYLKRILSAVEDGAAILEAAHKELGADSRRDEPLQVQFPNFEQSLKQAGFAFDLATNLKALTEEVTATKSLCEEVRDKMNAMGTVYEVSANLFGEMAEKLRDRVDVVEDALGVNQEKNHTHRPSPMEEDVLRRPAPRPKKIRMVRNGKLVEVSEEPVSRAVDDEMEWAVLNYDYDYSELPKRVLKQFEFRGPTIGYQAEVRAAAVIRGYWTNEDAMTVADWVGKRFGKRPCGETVNNWNTRFRKVVRKNEKTIVSFLREEMLPKKKVSGL